MYEEPKVNPSSDGVSVKSHEVGGEMTSDLSMRCFHYGLHDLSNQDRAFINHLFRTNEKTSKLFY